MTTRRAVQVRSIAPRKPTWINKVAENTVNTNATAICEGLVEAAKLGHSMSAKLLLDLADGNVDIEEALEKRPLKTIAMRLGAEQQLPRNHSNAEEEKAPSQTALLTV